MSLTAAVSGFFLLFIQVVQGRYDWGVTYTSTEVCALKGSTVELSCTYTHPPPGYRETYTVEKSFWFTKVRNGEPVDLRSDSEYTDRVTSTCHEKHCTLRITDVRWRDSAEYKFRFITKQPDGKYSGDPGVTLAVRGLQVKVSRSQYSSWVDLECLSRCPLPPNPSYVWYKSGKRIQTETSSYSSYSDYSDSFSCALRGHENSHSPPVCASGYQCNRVTYTERRICAPKGSSVDVSCSYYSSDTITSKSWFSPGLSGEWQSPSGVTGQVQVLEKRRGNSALRISDLTESDSAEYRFRFTSGSSGWGSSLPGTTLNVTDLQVQVRRITAGRSNTKAELRCHSSCSPTGPLSYVWFRNTKKLSEEETSSYTGWVSVGEEISCAFKGHEGSPSPPVYAPKLPSVSVSPSAEIMEDSSVTLTCSSDANPAASYTWYKGNKTPGLQPSSKEAQLVFSSIQSSDSGEYYCEAENQLGKKTSERLTIHVKYAPKLPSVSVSPSAEIMEDSSVTLTCSSDANPAASYTWYKRNKTPDFQPSSKEAQLVFSSIQSSDSGVYYCEAENQLGKKTSERLTIHVKYAPKLPSVSVSPSGEIVEGSSVTLTCSSDANPAASYTWYMRNKAAPLGRQGIYQITSISPEDRGSYFCTSENQYGRINSSSVFIDVHYAPKLPSVSVTGDLLEGRSVTLTCSSDANPAASYTWLKENQTLLQGQDDVYSFPSIRSKDSGLYYCKSKNRFGQKKSTSRHIDVQYAPKPPSVSVSPSGEIMEGSSLNLTCSSDANPAASYTWYKKDEPTSKGSGPVLTISDVRVGHSGDYYCEAHNSRAQHNSTLLPVAVLRSMTSVAAGSVSAIFLVIIFLLVILFIWRKRYSKETSQPAGRPNNNRQLNVASPSPPAEEQEELSYASVRFVKHQDDPVYSNISPAPKRNRAKRKEEEEEDENDVDYTVVNFTRDRPSPQSKTHGVDDDPSAVYSTVMKTPRA